MHAVINDHRDLWLESRSERSLTRCAIYRPISPQSDGIIDQLADNKLRSVFRCWQMTATAVARENYYYFCLLPISFECGISHDHTRIHICMNQLRLFWAHLNDWWRAMSCFDAINQTWRIQWRVQLTRAASSGSFSTRSFTIGLDRQYRSFFPEQLTVTYVTELRSH